MRIIVTGKGGTGKTVISILLARALRELGHTVYLLDMDESNELIYGLLGVNPPEPLVSLFGGRPGLSTKLKQEGESGILRAIQEITGKTLEASALSEPYVRISPEGIRLIVVGKIRKFSEGCACPLNAFTRTLMRNLRLRDNEVLVVDTDAGIEHVGRGVEDSCDEIITIVDPTRESIQLAKYMKETAQSLGKKFRLILNKVTPQIESTLRKLVEEQGLNVDCVVPFDENVFNSCMLGSRLEADVAYKAILDFVKKTYSSSRTS